MDLVITEDSDLLVFGCQRVCEGEGEGEGGGEGEGRVGVRMRGGWG